MKQETKGIAVKRTSFFIIFLRELTWSNATHFHAGAISGSQILVKQLKGFIELFIPSRNWFGCVYWLKHEVQ